MPGRILVIDDDDTIRRPVAMLLRDEGYDVDEAATATDGLRRHDEVRPDCVLLDVNLPDMSGFDACRSLRASGDTPIIMVTARADTFDVVAGLEAGADDYVTKPFEPKELSARIRAMLRRARGAGQNPMMIQLGDDLEVLPDEGVVRRDGEEVALTRTEFRLLCEMASKPGRLFSRELLLELVWGYEYVAETKLVDVHIYRLRGKVERDPANPEHIVTVRGLGYKVVA